MKLKHLLLGAISIFAMLGIQPASAEYFVLPLKNEDPVKYDTITRLEVYWMYTMKVRFWPDGQKITVFYMDFNNRLHQEFCSDVLRVSTERFARNVEIYVNNGNAGYFQQVSGESEMFRKVSLTSGSIGYISRDYLMVNRGTYVEKLRIID